MRGRIKDKREKARRREEQDVIIMRRLGDRK